MCNELGYGDWMGACARDFRSRDYGLQSADGVFRVRTVRQNDVVDVDLLVVLDGVVILVVVDVSSQQDSINNQATFLVAALHRRGPQHRPVYAQLPIVGARFLRPGQLESAAMVDD